MPPPDRWSHAFGAYELAPGREPAPRPPFGVTVVGNLASEKGVGEAVRGVVRALAAAGIPHALLDFPDPGAANADATLAPTADAAHYPLTILSINPDALPLFARSVGPDFFRGRYTIGNWHWELSEFPPAWADRFDSVDEVWVGSRFTLDAVARASPVPVLRVPPALAFEPPPGQLGRDRLGLPGGAFVVLFLFDFASTDARKNPVGLVRAFRAAFPADPGVRLVLKFSRADRYPGRAAVVEAAGGDGRVVLLDGVLSRGQVLDLIDSCDCYASLHRAEGLGLPLAEGMALGKPVIGTRYSGNLDFMTDDNSLLVDAERVPIAVAEPPYEAGFVWAEPSVEHAAERMRWVVENRAAATAMGERAKADVAKTLSVAAAGARMRARLERIGRARVE